MKRSVTSQYLPHKPHPGWKGGDHKRRISSQYIPPPLLGESPQTPAYIEYRRARIHEQELHNKHNPRSLAARDVVVQYQQRSADGYMMHHQRTIQQPCPLPPTCQLRVVQQRKCILKQVPPLNTVIAFTIFDRAEIYGLWLSCRFMPSPAVAT